MVKAIPVNIKGEATGPAQNFSDLQWERMKRCFKNPAKFPFKEVDGGYREPVETELMVSTKDARPAEINKGLFKDGEVDGLKNEVEKGLKTFNKKK